MIIKDKDRYYVKSKTGQNLGGPYHTREEAYKRMSQVEYFKNKTASLKEVGLKHSKEKAPITNTKQPLEKGSLPSKRAGKGDKSLYTGKV